MDSFYIVTVSPLDRVSRGTYDYFSPQEYPVGSLITLSYGKRIIEALVISTKAAHLTKSDLKSKKFSLKKIQRQEAKLLFSSAYISAIHHVAHEHAAGFGSTLVAVTPNLLFKNKQSNKISPQQIKDDRATLQEYALQDEYASRIITIRSIIRESLARNEPVFIVAPSHRHLTLLAHSLSLDPTCIITGDTRVTRLRQVLKDIHETSSHSTYLITPKFLALTSYCKCTVILEHEASQFYKDRGRPFIDYRRLAYFIQNATGGTLVRSDILLETTTLYRHKAGIMKERYPVDFTVEGSAETHIVDMTKSTYPSFTQPEHSHVISPELLKLIENAVLHKKKIVLFTLRNGFQPVLTCNDCGERIIRKKYYDTIDQYKRGVFESQFKESEDAEQIVDRCHQCGSWRLRSSAIAIQHIHTLLTEQFGEYMAMIHGDMDHKESNKALELFEQSDTALILLTTETGLNSLTKKVDASAVVSMDALFAVPDIGVLEKTIRLLVRLHELSRSIILVQTRNPNSPVITHFKKGTLLPLYRQEIADRESLGYPPFTHIAKIRLDAKNPQTRTHIILIRDIFKGFKKEMYPSFHNSRFEESVIILIKAHSESEWEDVLSRITSLPLDIEVDASPISLL